MSSVTTAIDTQPEFETHHHITVLQLPMKLTTKDIEELKLILAACKVLGVDGVVITDGKASGAKPSLDAAILTHTNLSISEALRIGIGRVTELDKRLAIFPNGLEIEGKSNEAGDVSLLTLSSGKTKMQFRCTSVALMKYPKENADQEFGVISLKKDEVIQLSKAARTLGSETVVLHASRDGTVTLECVDSSNDKFVIELSSPIEFSNDHESAVQTYLASLLVDVLDAGLKDLKKEDEVVSFTLGEAGSVTTKIKNQTVLIFPQITGDE